MVSVLVVAMQLTAYMRIYMYALFVRVSIQNLAVQKKKMFVTYGFQTTLPQPTKVKKFKLAHSPFNSSALRKFLSNYPNSQIVEEVMNGFQFGFRLHYNGPRDKTAPNLPSFYKYADIARDIIAKEIAKERVAGPFQSRPIPTLRVSLLGVVPTEAEFRVIHHLSYPTKNSVNDYIDDALCSVNYTKFDEAISMVHRLGRDVFLAKSDIKSAFRLLPIWPGDFELPGFKFDNCYYFDKCLPFGCSISCSAFEKFSSFLE